MPIDESAAEAFLPSARPDGSGVGVNYADQLLKPLKLTAQEQTDLVVFLESLSTLSNPWRPEDLDVCR